jgi:broad specificity phosphatase PhoE
MTIFLIRHAQSAFNAVYDPLKPDPMIFDAPITKLGEVQAQQASSQIEKLDIKSVIVSPFTRTLQTAQLIFGNRLPFQISADVREQLCNSCDIGSTPNELSKNFPYFDFNHLDERWWYNGAKDHRGIPVEPEEVLIERTNSFKTRLIRENIQSTAIVSHGNFIRALTGIKPKNCEIVRFDPRDSILEGIGGNRFC